MPRHAVGMSVDDQLVNVIEPETSETCIDTFKNVFP